MERKKKCAAEKSFIIFVVIMLSSFNLRALFLQKKKTLLVKGLLGYTETAFCLISINRFQYKSS